jgi:hypothetical protein
MCCHLLGTHGACCCDYGPALCCFPPRLLLPLFSDDDDDDDNDGDNESIRLWLTQIYRHTSGPAFH